MSGRKRLLVYGGGFVLLIVLGLIGALAGRRETRDAVNEQGAFQVPLGTPVESLTDCPWGEASCVLALGIERALRFNRVDAVVDFAEPAFYDCPGRPQQGPDEPFPLCEGQPLYTRLEGYPIAHRNGDRSIVNEGDLWSFVQRFVDAVNSDAHDDVGDGRIRLYAFGCPERATPLLNVSCARLAIVLSAILGKGDDAHRELLIFWAVGLFGGQTLPVTEVWQGPVPDNERAILFDTGGYLADLGDIYVIDQSLRKLEQ
jgi:hypothetical protein